MEIKKVENVNDLINSIFLEVDCIEDKDIHVGSELRCEDAFNDNTGFSFYANRDPKYQDYFLVKKIALPRKESSSSESQGQVLEQKVNSEGEDLETKSELVREAGKEIDGFVSLVVGDQSNEKESIIKSLKQQAIEDGNLARASSLAKNLSLIFLIELDNFAESVAFNNLVLAVEESTDYFKKYVLVYTKKEAADIVNKINERVIDIQQLDLQKSELLSDILDSEKDYNSYLEGDRDGYFSMALKLFSKLPVLHYNFKPKPVPTVVKDTLSTELRTVMKWTELQIESFNTFIKQDFSTDDYSLDLANDLIEEGEGLVEIIETLVNDEEAFEKWLTK